LEIERQTDLLADHPLMGREDRVKGTRELVIGRTPFIAVYCIKKEEGRNSFAFFARRAAMAPV